MPPAPQRRWAGLALGLGALALVACGLRGERGAGKAHATAESAARSLAARQARRHAAAGQRRPPGLARPGVRRRPGRPPIAFVTCVPLLTYADEPGEGGRTLVPGLARRLPQVGKDGKSLHLALKAHVQFANGETVTPADVKATFDRLMDPKLHSPGAALFGDLKGLAAYRAGRADTISGITISAGGVTFHLNTSGRSLLARVASPYTCPLPASTPHTPIGATAWREDATGPYRLAADGGGHITLVRNDALQRRHPRSARRRADPDRRADRPGRARGDRRRSRTARPTPCSTGRAVPPRRWPTGATFLSRADRRRLVPADRRGLAAVRPAGRAHRDLARARPARDRRGDGPGTAIGTDALLPATLPSARSASPDALRPDPELARRLYIRAISEAGEQGPFDITFRVCPGAVCKAEAEVVERAFEVVFGKRMPIVSGGSRPLELGWLHPLYADPAAIVEPIVAPTGLRGPTAPPPVAGDSARSCG